MPEISHEIERAVQIPHPLEDSDNQILSSRDGEGVTCPGYARQGGGEMLKFRFDWYITVQSPTFAQTSSMNEDKNSSYRLNEKACGWNNNIWKVTKSATAM